MQFPIPARASVIKNKESVRGKLSGEGAKMPI